VYIINLDRFPEDIHTNEIPETLLHRVQIRDIQWTRLKFSTYDLLYTGWVILIYGPEYLPNYGIYKKMV